MIFQPFGSLSFFTLRKILLVFAFYLIYPIISSAFEPLSGESPAYIYGKTGNQPHNETGQNAIILPYYPFEHPLTRQADSLFIHDANRAALDKYREANLKFRASGNMEGMAYSGNMIAEILTNRLTDFPAALRQLQSNESFISKNLGVEHPLISDTYLTYGSYYGRNSNPDLEKRYLDRSFQIRQDQYGLRSLQMAELFYRMGQYYQYSLRDYEEARDFYKRALTLYREFLPNAHPDRNKAFYSLGSCYRELSDFQRAKIYMDHALYYYKLDSISNVTRIMNAVLAKSNILNDTRVYRQSLNLYNEAIDLVLKVYGPFYYYLKDAYTGRGVAYLRIGEYEEALQDFENALEVYDYYNPGQEDFSLLVNKGECFTKMMQKDSARMYLFEAVNQLKVLSPDNLQGISYSYRAIGEMYKDFKKSDSALYYTQKALITLIPSFQSMNYDQNPELSGTENTTDLINILAQKANIYLAISKESQERRLETLLKALEIFVAIDHLSDNLKDSELAEESKLFLLRDIHQIYENAIHCTNQLYLLSGDDNYIEISLKFFEKNKYTLLFQNLELARKSNELNIPFEYQFKQDSLEMLLAALQQHTEGEDLMDVNESSALKVEVDNAIMELRAEIKSEYPNFYQVEYDQLTVNLDQMKDFARKNDCLLMEFFAGDSNFFALVVDKDEMDLHRIERTEAFNQTVADFLNMISHVQESGNIESAYKSYTNAAYIIFQHLFDPVVKHHEISDNTNIIISPDGLLAQLPFEALISNPPSNQFPDFSKLDYLLYRYDISYVYSFNLFFKDESRKPTRKNKLLAFSYSGIDIQTNPEKRSADFIELPGTQQEIASIKNILKGRNRFLEDEEATETQFKSRSGEYEILHLAVHGVADNESSINSRLIFKNQKDSLNDGNLFLYELYNVDLTKAKLAILSACETGIGKEFRGEGVFSVARGFASAGCPSIIMSLWRVNDLVSAEIMSGFYGNLKKGRPVNAALRKAKIDYIRNTEVLGAHPANWAAFVPLGQMNAVYTKKMSPVWIGLIVVGLLVLTAVMLRYLKH